MDIIAFIDKVISIQQVLVITILLIVNFLTGVISGVFTKTLCWPKIGDIMKRASLMFGLYLVMCVPAYYLSNQYGTDWQALRALALTGVVIPLVDKILVNLKEIGLPLPATTNSGTGTPGSLTAKQKVTNGTEVTSVLCALPLLKLLSSNIPEEK
jgi:hypothetical protein